MNHKGPRNLAPHRLPPNLARKLYAATTYPVYLLFCYEFALTTVQVVSAARPLSPRNLPPRRLPPNLARTPNRPSNPTPHGHQAPSASMMTQHRPISPRHVRITADARNHSTNVADGAFSGMQTLQALQPPGFRAYQPSQVEQRSPADFHHGVNVFDSSRNQHIANVPTLSSTLTGAGPVPQNSMATQQQGSVPFPTYSGRQLPMNLMPPFNPPPLPRAHMPRATEQSYAMLHAALTKQSPQGVHQSFYCSRFTVSVTQELITAVNKITCTGWKCCKHISVNVENSSTDVHAYCWDGSDR